MTILVPPGASGAEKPCLFPIGSYARTSDGIVCVMGGGESGYGVVRTERDEKCFYRADELTLWGPLPDDWVVEAGNENCMAGVVISVENGVSLVKWPYFIRPQAWLNADLEPAWSQQ